jgi:hypothetical protein
MLIMLVAAFGCSKSSKAPVPEKKPEPKQKSSVAVMIDGATGKTAIDAGIKTKAKIEKISAKHNADLNEVLGE